MSKISISANLGCLVMAGMLFSVLAGMGCENAPVKPPPVSVPGPKDKPPAHDSTKTTKEGTELGPQAAGDELFAEWEKPDLVLVVSGEQNGYLEPCGCAGLDNQKGGLARRHTFLKQLTAKGWTTAPIDLGNQIRSFGSQQEIKFHTTIEGLKTMGYTAVGYGPDDLRLPVGELISDAANDASGITSANVAITGFEDAVPKFRVIDRGGRKVAVAAVMGERAWQRVNNGDLAWRPAEAALTEVLPGMKQKAELLVLLSHGTPEEALELARKFPEFRLVITAGGADEPPPEPKVVDGTKTWLVEVGHKGMYLAAIGLYGDAARPLRYQRVSLDKRFAASPEMHNLMVAYQGQLRARGFAGLGLTPSKHPSGRSFVGSQACAECHTKAFEVFSKTPHAHATETLVKLDPPRQFDAECVSCHTTGWEPQKFHPYASGFWSLEKTPLLAGNGCENCHGPGSAHVAVELGEVQVNAQEQTRLREQMRLPLDLAKSHCMECHDLDNSPEFGFDKYWPKVEHRGKD